MSRTDTGKFFQSSSAGEKNSTILLLAEPLVSFTMGWFPPSHVDQGFIFGLLGIWHLYNTLRNYTRSPATFKASTWFPFDHPRLRFRSLELFVPLRSSSSSSSSSSRTQPPTSDAAGVISMPHLGRFQHVTFALFFLVYAITGLVQEQTSLLDLLHCIFASGFLMELAVFHFGHHPGDDLESFVHMLMQIVLVFLVLFMLLEVRFPRSVLVSVARCMMLCLKGAWFAQTGLMLRYEAFVPMGCKTDETHEYPVCAGREAMMRAKSLQVLIFNWQVLCILVGAIVGYGVMARTVRRGVVLVSPRPLLPSVLTPKSRASILTPRAREKEASVYFQVPEEMPGEHSSGESDGEGAPAEVVDAYGVKKALARRMSSRNAQGPHVKPTTTD